MTQLDLHQALRYDESAKGLFHGYKAGEEHRPYCNHRSCMYMGGNSIQHREKVMENCPCLKMRRDDQPDQPLKAICFIKFLKTLNPNLVDHRFDDEDKTIERINPDQVMFCHSASGLFDDSYPGFVRDPNQRLRGWDSVRSYEDLDEVLRWTYWYRRYADAFKIQQQIKKLVDAHGIRAVKTAVTHACHTANGLLMKLFFAFGPECPSYKSIAKHSCQLFKSLLEDYMKPLQFEGGVAVEPTQESSVYVEIKNLCNLVKSSFHKQEREDRIEWLNYQFINPGLKRLVESCFRRLQTHVNNLWITELKDYSRSLAFVYRCTTFCQTRVMGYLPTALAEYRRAQFRDTVNRPLEKVPQEKLDFIRLCVHKRLERVCESGEFGPFTKEETHDQLLEAVGDIQVTLKSSASVAHTVSDGGKLEDARQLLRLAIDNRWEIPIRDLDTHKKVSSFILELDVDSIPEWTRPLFWLSYQLILNFWIRKGVWKDTSHYHPFFLADGKEYKVDPMVATIVHISEPGKERNLTKSSAILAWFLTPIAKVLMSVLSRQPEHKVGLFGSSHEWNHGKRISAESHESAWMWNLDHSLRSSVLNIFKDWKESTDFICKKAGWAHLSAALEFIQFPRLYTELTKFCVTLPQPVEEVIHYSRDYESEFERRSIRWTGAIREGYMMGNPVTKPCLHLIHDSEIEANVWYLEQQGLRLEDSSKLNLRRQNKGLDRDTIDTMKVGVISIDT
jgi:hypothetical protein